MQMGRPPSEKISSQTTSSDPEFTAPPKIPKKGNKIFLSVDDLNEQYTVYNENRNSKH